MKLPKKGPAWNHGICPGRDSSDIPETAVLSLSITKRNTTIRTTITRTRRKRQRQHHETHPVWSSTATFNGTIPLASSRTQAQKGTETRVPSRVTKATSKSWLAVNMQSATSPTTNSTRNSNHRIVSALRPSTTLTCTSPLPVPQDFSVPRAARFRYSWPCLRHTHIASGKQKNRKKKHEHWKKNMNIGRHMLQTFAAFGRLQCSLRAVKWRHHASHRATPRARLLRPSNDRCRWATHDVVRPKEVSHYRSLSQQQ